MKVIRQIQKELQSKEFNNQKVTCDGTFLTIYDTHFYTPSEQQQKAMLQSWHYTGHNGKYFEQKYGKLTYGVKVEIEYKNTKKGIQCISKVTVGVET